MAYAFISQSAVRCIVQFLVTQLLGFISINLVIIVIATVDFAHFIIFDSTVHYSPKAVIFKVRNRRVFGEESRHGARRATEHIKS